MAVSVVRDVDDHWRTETERAGDNALHDHDLALYHDWLRAAPRLSAAEEAALVAQMRAGDNAARTRLWHGYLLWALKIAYWYASRRAPIAELAQVAFLTLWVELPKVDAQRGKVSNRVTGPIMREVSVEAARLHSLITLPQSVRQRERRARLMIPTTSLTPEMEATIPQCESQEADVAAAVEAALLRASAIATLNLLLAHELSDIEQRIIVLRYEAELTFTEIAARIEMTQGYVSKWHARALEKLAVAAKRQPEIAAALLDVLT